MRPRGKDPISVTFEPEYSTIIEQPIQDDIEWLQTKSLLELNMKKMEKSLAKLSKISNTTLTTDETGVDSSIPFTILKKKNDDTKTVSTSYTGFSARTTATKKARKNLQWLNLASNTYYDHTAFHDRIKIKLIEHVMPELTSMLRRHKEEPKPPLLSDIHWDADMELAFQKCRERLKTQLSTRARGVINWARLSFASIILNPSMIRWLHKKRVERLSSDSQEGNGKPQQMSINRYIHYMRLYYRGNKFNISDEKKILQRLERFHSQRKRSLVSVSTSLVEEKITQERSEKGTEAVRTNRSTLGANAFAGEEKECTRGSSLERPSSREDGEGGRGAQSEKGRSSRRSELRQSRSSSAERESTVMSTVVKNSGEEKELLKPMENEGESMNLFVSNYEGNKYLSALNNLLGMDWNVQKNITNKINSLSRQKLFLCELEIADSLFHIFEDNVSAIYNIRMLFRKSLARFFRSVSRRSNAFNKLKKLREEEKIKFSRQVLLNKVRLDQMERKDLTRFAFDVTKPPNYVKPLQSKNPNLLYSRQHALWNARKKYSIGPTSEWIQSTPIGMKLEAVKKIAACWRKYKATRKRTKVTQSVVNESEKNQEERNALLIQKKLQVQEKILEAMKKKFSSFHEYQQWLAKITYTPQMIATNFEALLTEYTSTFAYDSRTSPPDNNHENTTTDMSALLYAHINKGDETAAIDALRGLVSYGNKYFLMELYEAVLERNMFSLLKEMISRRFLRHWWINKEGQDPLDIAVERKSLCAIAIIVEHLIIPNGLFEAMEQRRMSGVWRTYLGDAEMDNLELIMTNSEARGKVLAYLSPDWDMKNMKVGVSRTGKKKNKSEWRPED